MPVDPDIVAAFVKARRRAKRPRKPPTTQRLGSSWRCGRRRRGGSAPWRVKYTTVRQERLNADELRTRYPQIAAECTRESGYRKPDVRAIKEKK